MSALIRWQIIGAATGLALAMLSFLAAAGMKGWVRLPLPFRSVPGWHRYTGWSSFLAYVIIAFSCLEYHYPITEPLALLDYGWFAVHPLNGLLGTGLYAGKILVARRWKRAWKTPGLLLGWLLLACWLVQLATVAPAILAWVETG